MGFSLEFGKYGAESLGKLVAESKPKQISKELSKKLFNKAYELEKTAKSDTFSSVDKYGRTVITNKAGYKEILDKEGNIVYLRRPDTSSFSDFVGISSEGYPTLRYIIDRPNSKVDRTILRVKSTENGIVGSHMSTYGQDGDVFYRRQNV